MTFTDLVASRNMIIIFISLIAIIGALLAIAVRLGDREEWELEMKKKLKSN